MGAHSPADRFQGSAARTHVAPRDHRPQPEWPAVHRELRRPGVTLQVLWEDHRAAHPDGYG